MNKFTKKEQLGLLKMEKLMALNLVVNEGQEKTTLEVECLQDLLELFKQGYELMLVKPEVRKPIIVTIETKQKGEIKNNE